MSATAADELFAPAEAAAAPEIDLVRDLGRRAVPAAPVLVAVAALAAGAHGALSAAVAIALVVANFAVAAASLAWAARINLALVMGVALFGYLARLGVLFVVVLLLRDLGWVHLPSLGLTLIATHLGLLLWELRYVSASLAHPALKPSNPARKEHTR